jgi:hypothetical protein
LIETPGLAMIESLAVVEWFGRVERVGQLPNLDGWHDWTEATLLKRFHYRTPGLWALGVRVFRRSEPWALPITASQLGCKTWVPLELPLPTSGLVAVLGQSESDNRLASIRQALAADDSRT